MGTQENRSRKIGQLRSLVSMNEDDKNELNYALKVVELATELLVDDLDDSISLDHHSQLWTALKWCIDRAKGSTKDKISITNTASSVASAFSSLMNLLYLLDSEYDLPSEKAPSPFTSTPSHSLKKSEASQGSKTTILSYISVRLGDLFRYKKDIAAAAQWYRYAITVDPSNGEGWNQIGILSSQLGSPLDAVYSYYRATFTSNPSTIASSNILTILDAQLDGDPDEMDDDSFVLHSLAHIHYLRPLSPALLTRLPSLLSSPRRLLPFIAALSSLDHHSTTSSSLLALFQKAFDHFREEIDEMEPPFDSSTRTTLHLYSRVLPSDSLDLLLGNESRSTDEIDAFQMDHFICSPLSSSSQ